MVVIVLISFACIWDSLLVFHRVLLYLEIIALPLLLFIIVRKCYFWDAFFLLSFITAGYFYGTAVEEKHKTNRISFMYVDALCRVE